MHLHFPREVSSDRLAQTQVLANVYGGNDRSLTQMRIDGGEWIEMQMVRQPDPYYERLYELQERYKEEHERLPGLASQGRPMNSTHLWKANLPAELQPGSYLIEVRSTDMFGQVWRHRRPLRVVPAREVEAETEPEN